MRSKLRLFLQNQAIPDDELIPEMNVIFSQEQEREAKLGKKGQKYTIGRVENITQVAPAQEPCIQRTEEKKPLESQKSLEATLNTVQAGLSEFKASFEEFKSKPTKESEVKPRPPKRPPRDCESCVAKISLKSVHIALFVVIQVILHMVVGTETLQKTGEGYDYPGATHS